MNAPLSSESRHHRLRETYRRELGEVGVFIEGTLSKVRRPGRKAPAWQLTFKQAGKTRTVYVPVDLVPEVQKWASEFKRLKVLIRKVTRQNLAIIRKHVAARRAANRAQRLTPRRSAGNSQDCSSMLSRR